MMMAKTKKRKKKKPAPKPEAALEELGQVIDRLEAQIKSRATQMTQSLRPRPATILAVAGVAAVAVGVWLMVSRGRAVQSTEQTTAANADSHSRGQVLARVLGKGLAAGLKAMAKSRQRSPEAIEK